jgi:hypothetical protein
VSTSDPSQYCPDSVTWSPNKPAMTDTDILYKLIKDLKDKKARITRLLDYYTALNQRSMSDCLETELLTYQNILDFVAEKRGDTNG